MMPVIKKKQRPKLKCDCGEPVSPGSVFCAKCRAGVNRKNAKTVEKAEKKYRREMRGTWKKKK